MQRAVPCCSEPFAATHSLLESVTTCARHTIGPECVAANVLRPAAWSHNCLRAVALDFSAGTIDVVGKATTSEVTVPMAMLLVPIVLVACIWLASETRFGQTDGPRRLDGPPFTSQGRLWLALGSLVLSIVMAKLGIPFFFVLLPPVFLVFRSGSRRE